MFLAHSSTSCSQVAPSQVSGHWQKNELKVLTQEPPLRHGLSSWQWSLARPASSASSLFLRLVINRLCFRHLRSRLSLPCMASCSVLTLSSRLTSRPPSSEVRPLRLVSRLSSLAASLSPECSSLWPPCLVANEDKSSRLTLTSSNKTRWSQYYSKPPPTFPSPLVLSVRFLLCPAWNTRPPSSERIRGLNNYLVIPIQIIISLTNHQTESPLTED